MRARKRTAPSVRADSTSRMWCRFVSAACLEFDWSQIAADTIADARLAAVVAKGLESLGRYIQREIDRTEDDETAHTVSDPGPVSDDEHHDSGRPVVEETPAPDEPPPVVDERAAAAAALLGVAVVATEDEIRAALRARLASSKLHPDHGGDGEEAKRLIAAKNLLVERARAARSTHAAA